VEGTAWNWIEELAPLLQNIAAERILKELGEILKQRRVAGYVRHMSNCGVLGAIFPEFGQFNLQPAVDCLVELETIHHELADMFPHQAGPLEAYLTTTLSGGRTRQVTLKLAALLTALPAAGRRSPLEAVGRRLTLSGPELKLLLLLVQLSQNASSVSSADARALHRFFRAAAGDTPGVCLLILARAPAKTDTASRLLESIRHLLDLYFDPDNMIAHSPRWVTGDELQSRFGLSPGPLIGQLLDAISEAQAAGEIARPAEAWQWAASWLSQERSRP